MLKFKKMGTEKIPLLLVTANVGSIFESPTEMLPIWITEFVQTVSKMDVKLVGLHMQEVGGKTYEKSMQHVQDFVKRLSESPELRLFDKMRIYLDEDFSSPERFTALGNIYMVHSSLTDVKLWDWVAEEWTGVEGKETHSGSIDHVPTKQKAKFPQNFFPECKWSRKGFMRTRWLIKGTTFELVNVHLFHDASNLLAMEGSPPSKYARSRSSALRHTLHHMHQDNPPPFFMFGDFNFRLDTAGVVKKLTEKLTPNRIYNGKTKEYSKVQFKSEGDDRVVLTIGKKDFNHVEHQKIFREPWVLKYDKEVEPLKPHLYEFPIKFHPTYPFEENIELPTHYMKTRCPAWCDRILLSQAARLIIHQSEGPRQTVNLSDSRRSINQDINRKSLADSWDSGGGGGSPSKNSQKSSGQNSSSENSPARSNSPTTHINNASPAKKLNLAPEFEGLTVPGIAQSRKSIADPTNVVHAINASNIMRCEDGSPTRRRLTRNQSEGSPKMGEHINMELRKGAECGSQVLRRRPEYGVIGETTCMGDHKPVYLRVLLQSDKGTVVCCDQPDPSDFCYYHSNHECFRQRLASQISYDSGIRSSSFNKDFPSPVLPSSLDAPSLLPGDSAKLKLSDYESSYSDTKDDNVFISSPLSPNHRSISKNSVNNSDNFVIPSIQINIVDSEYYDELTTDNNIDINTQYLFCARAPPEPYTPESLDSHSPCPELNDGSDADKQTFGPMNAIPNTLNESLPSSNVNEISFFRRKSLSNAESSFEKPKSVSPTQLKSRLENFLRSASAIDMDEMNGEDSDEVDEIEIEATFKLKNVDGKIEIVDPSDEEDGDMAPTASTPLRSNHKEVPAQNSLPRINDASKHNESSETKTKCGWNCFGWKLF